MTRKRQFLLNNTLSDRRQETTAKPQRTETTVVFLPDVWSVMPTSEDYAKTTKLYEEALQTKLVPAKKEGPAPKKDKNIARKDINEENLVIYNYNQLDSYI